MSFLMFSIRYGLRNLRRNQRRSLLLIMTVGLTVVLSMVGSRYAAAVIELWRVGAIETGAGDAQFHRQGYWERDQGLDEDLLFQGNNDLEEMLNRDPNVATWVKRVKFEGLIVSDHRSSYFVGQGVEGKREELISSQLFNENNDEGRFVDTEDPSGAVLARSLAKLLKVSVGDTVTLVATTAQGSANAVDVVVRGIVDVTLPSFSGHSLYVPLELSQKLLRLQGAYNEIAVRIGSQMSPNRFVQRYDYQLRDDSIEVQGWWSIEPLIGKVEKIWVSVAGLLCLLLVLSAVLTVVNIIFMIVGERSSEIGMLMAIGAKSWMIRAFFFTEGGIIGAFGGLCGLLVAGIIVLVLNLQGIPFESPFGSGVLTVRPRLDLYWTGLTFACSILICAACAVMPANRALRIDPAMVSRKLV